MKIICKILFLSTLLFFGKCFAMEVIEEKIEENDQQLKVETDAAKRQRLIEKKQIKSQRLIIEKQKEIDEVDRKLKVEINQDEKQRLLNLKELKIIRILKEEEKKKNRIERQEHRKKYSILKENIFNQEQWFQSEEYNELKNNCLIDKKVEELTLIVEKLSEYINNLQQFYDLFPVKAQKTRSIEQKNNSYARHKKLKEQIDIVTTKKEEYLKLLDDIKLLDKNIHLGLDDQKGKQSKDQIVSTNSKFDESSEYESKDETDGNKHGSTDFSKKDSDISGGSVDPILEDINKLITDLDNFKYNDETDDNKYESADSSKKDLEEKREAETGSTDSYDSRDLESTDSSENKSDSSGGSDDQYFEQFSGEFSLNQLREGLGLPSLGTEKKDSLNIENIVTDSDEFDDSEYESKDESTDSSGKDSNGSGDIADQNNNTNTAAEFTDDQKINDQITVSTDSKIEESVEHKNDDETTDSSRENFEEKRESEETERNDLLNIENTVTGSDKIDESKFSLEDLKKTLADEKIERGEKSDSSENESKKDYRIEEDYFNEELQAQGVSWCLYNEFGKVYVSDYPSDTKLHAAFKFNKSLDCLEKIDSLEEINNFYRNNFFIDYKTHEFQVNFQVKKVISKEPSWSEKLDQLLYQNENKSKENYRIEEDFNEKLESQGVDCCLFSKLGKIYMSGYPGNEKCFAAFKFSESGVLVKIDSQKEIDDFYRNNCFPNIHWFLKKPRVEHKESISIIDSEGEQLNTQTQISVQSAQHQPVQLPSVQHQSAQQSSIQQPSLPQQQTIVVAQRPQKVSRQLAVTRQQRTINPLKWKSRLFLDWWTKFLWNKSKNAFMQPLPVIKKQVVSKKAQKQVKALPLPPIQPLQHSNQNRLIDDLIDSVFNDEEFILNDDSFEEEERPLPSFVIPPPISSKTYKTPIIISGVCMMVGAILYYIKYKKQAPPVEQEQNDDDIQDDEQSDEIIENIQQEKREL